MKVLMWLVCNVYVMELWWVIDVIVVLIDQILSGDMVNVDVSQDLLSMEHSV